MQETIHRVQPYEQTRDLIETARALGFTSINVDLIYGLPYQTAQRFRDTVAQVLTLAPDRIAMFSYAHVPWLRKQQGAFATKLPEGMEKFGIFCAGLQAFLDAGYLYIGMDHFARPGDELAVAQRNRTLHRNFQGYTTKAGADLYGMGVSAISSIGTAYAQNQRDVPAYSAAIANGGLATMRGYRLSEDDRLRRAVISRLLCHTVIRKREIEKRVWHQLRRIFRGGALAIGAFREPMAWSNSIATRFASPGWAASLFATWPWHSIAISSGKKRIASRYFRKRCSFSGRTDPFRHVRLPATPVPVVVIGGGISGLACAFRLQQRGIPVILFEKSDRVGGVISAEQKDGFLFEFGPQGVLLTAAVAELVEAAGMTGDMIRANPHAARFILYRGKLVQAPMSPPALLRSRFLDARTKWRLATEPLRRTHPPESDESVAAFVRRKFGPSLLENLVAPFVSGVYAGDPELLSLRAAFPQVHEWECEHGSVLRGAIRQMRKKPGEGGGRPGLVSFRCGMNALLEALAARLGERISCGASVISLSRNEAHTGAHFTLQVARGAGVEAVDARAVVIATEPNAVSRSGRVVAPPAAAALQAITMVPVIMVSAGYRREDVGHSLEGFGFLVPRKERLRTLGTIWNSSLFPGRAPAGHVCDDELHRRRHRPGNRYVARRQSRGNRSRRDGARPANSWRACRAAVRRYKRALPQYNLGHTQRVGRHRAKLPRDSGLLRGRKLSQRAFLRRLRRARICRGGPDRSAGTTTRSIMLKRARGPMPSRVYSGV